MNALPGGLIASRPLHFIWILDSSGSMEGEKIQQLNFAIREAIPAIQDAASENPNVHILVRAVAFSNGARWQVGTPTLPADFRWSDVSAGGVTDMGRALFLVADQLRMPPMTDRAVSPVLVMISDGHATDDFGSGLKALLAEPWGKKAIRLAIAVGQDADRDALTRFMGSTELKPLQADDTRTLVQCIRWASTAVLNSADASLQVQVPVPSGPGGSTVPIPGAPQTDSSAASESTSSIGAGSSSREAGRPEVGAMTSGMLSPDDEVRTASWALPCRVESLIGAGSQGEVYRASVEGSAFALKWYYDDMATEDQRAALRALIDAGPPDARFLWPVELVTGLSKPGFGYLMTLREPRYRRISDLLARRVTPSFRSLATAGAHLAEGFFRLHAKGRCYRDISPGNVFVDPDSGDVLICDNDNVGVDGKRGGILGTPRFMAPEVVRGEALPSTQTDLFSLAVLLFLILVNHHPLEGRKEADTRCLDLPAMSRLYGTEPVFIFDPVDHSNEPVPWYHDNALAFWPIYPAFLRKLFTRSFTEGIRDPDQGRIRDSTWRTALTRLRDSILYCGCGAENFYDADALQAAGGSPGSCWKCSRPIQLPPRIRIGKSVVMLNHDSKLFRHQLEQDISVDFTTPLAEVTRHPTIPTLWGLKNLTAERWTATASDGTVRNVEPARTVPLAMGTRVNFGNTMGEIRLGAARSNSMQSPGYARLPSRLPGAPDNFLR